jgi:hypothetical protein
MKNGRARVVESCCDGPVFVHFGRWREIKKVVKITRKEYN